MAVEQVQDNPPSRAGTLPSGIEVPAETCCLAVGPRICTHDWYAYSAEWTKWKLSLEDPKGFALANGRTDSRSSLPRTRARFAPWSCIRKALMAMASSIP